jgi:hypothetical protein
MAIYKVVLTDYLGAVKSPQLYLKINSILQGYFDRVAKAAKFDRAVVFWLPATKVDLADNELLIYFVPAMFSITAEREGKPPGGVAAIGGHSGRTLIPGRGSRDNTTAAEVVVDSLDAAQLANLAFHEAMHNKLQLGNSLHNGDGLRGSAPSKGDPTGGLVTPSTNLTPTNVVDMAAALRNRVPQWTKGIDLILSRKARRDGGDGQWDTM